MERIEKAGVTLNKEKCEFRKRQVNFLGHLIDAEGIRADPEKTKALQEMPTPKTISELRRFMGMANQLGKFSPRLAELSQPLRELLSTKRVWVWDCDQDRAFADVKAELIQPTVLALYDLPPKWLQMLPRMDWELSFCRSPQTPGGQWRMLLAP